MAEGRAGRRLSAVQLGKTGTGAERQLTAILAADVAGYSRLVENDEEGTLTQWKAHWHALIEPKIKEFHGRIVRVIGDGVLVEFASVVDAVRCAVEVQRGMASRNAEVPHDKRIEFRMGINFGELIIDGRDFWGDAVNIAARLEALAEPGGICVSGRVQEDVKGKLDIVFEDAGEQQLKNIARSVRVYRIRTGSEVPTPPVIQRKSRAAGSRLRGGLVAVALLVLLGGGVWQLVSHLFPLSQVIREVQAPALLPDKRSIAVLPFLNMSSDPEQEYFSDGMTEDLITELSRLKGLFVIARNSVYTFKGRAVKTDQVSRELYRVPKSVNSWAIPQRGRVRFKMTNRGGSSCRLRYRYGRILKRRSCAVWPRKAKMALKPGGFWHLRRSMTVRRAPRRPRSAVSGFRSSGTGCCASTLADLTLS